VTAGGDGARQAAQVDSFAAQRVAAILIDPVDTVALSGAIARANRTGIPVFTMVTASDQGSVVSHIGSDYRMGGGLAGWYVGERARRRRDARSRHHRTLRAARGRVASPGQPGHDVGSGAGAPRRSGLARGAMTASRATATSHGPIEAQVERALTDRVMAGEPMAQLAHLIMIGVIAVLLWGRTSTALLLAWVATIVVGVGVRAAT